ncbi:MAG: DNA adenine methylase [Phaeospirillum sp.]|nr:DNA adenine methylase [Phaeospirillum sp.]
MGAPQNHHPVDPLPGLLPWLGGKRNLAARLIRRIEAIPHTCYAEPFLGMGGVFFRRRRRPPVEALNDLNRDVSNLFRVVRRHPDALLAELSYSLNSRADFERLRATPPESLTDVERAARFYTLQQLSFAGKVRTPTFGYSAMSAGRLAPSRFQDSVKAAHARLERVYIDGLPFGDFIARWDRPATLFYLDPPYFGCETDYGKELFSRDDFARLADQLAGIRGRFLLSLNDRPEVRDIFGRFQVEAVQTTYTAGGGQHAKSVGEVIISGGRGE